MFSGSLFLFSCRFSPITFIIDSIIISLSEELIRKLKILKLLTFFRLALFLSLLQKENTCRNICLEKNIMTGLITI